jgi:predicted small lipoprotein YifL
MPKLIATFLALLGILALTACGGTGEIEVPAPTRTNDSIVDETTDGTLNTEATNESDSNHGFDDDFGELWEEYQSLHHAISPDFAAFTESLSYDEFISLANTASAEFQEEYPHLEISLSEWSDGFRLWLAYKSYDAVNDANEFRDFVVSLSDEEFYLLANIYAIESPRLRENFSRRFSFDDWRDGFYGIHYRPLPGVRVLRDGFELIAVYNELDTHEERQEFVDTMCDGEFTRLINAWLAERRNEGWRMSTDEQNFRSNEFYERYGRAQP